VNAQVLSIELAMSSILHAIIMVSLYRGGFSLIASLWQQKLLSTYSFESRKMPLPSCAVERGRADEK
jgi:hypothetical protein